MPPAPPAHGMTCPSADGPRLARADRLRCHRARNRRAAERRRASFRRRPSGARDARVTDPDDLRRAPPPIPKRSGPAFAAELEWIQPWTKVLDWKPPHAKWFVGGQLNVSVNCLDRHVRTARRNKAAIIWEGEPGDRRTLTYFDLHRQVCQFANVLKSLGVEEGRSRRALHAAHSRAGDRDARLRAHRRRPQRRLRRLQRRGAARSHQRRAGIRARHRRRRLSARPDRAAQADGRRGAARHAVDPARRRRASAAPASRSPVAHAGGPRSLVPRADAGRAGRRARRSRWTPRTCSTSSTRRARPESRRASSTRRAATSSAPTRRRKWVFDLRDDDVYWCTADIGWVTGHSYVVYGPLANGATVLMYEGAPDWPEKDRFWQLIERYGVTIFYTAPTAIRAFMKWGTEWPAGAISAACGCSDRSASRSIPKRGCGTTSTSAAAAVPIVDTWWQTETGHILITPLPGLTPLKPGSATQAVSRASPRRSAPPTGERVDAGRRTARADRSRGPACCAASTAIPSASCSSTGASGRTASTSPATARASTGRLLLAARPRRRRAERRRASDRHDGSRERARRSSEGGRGGGRRQDARDQGAGGRGVRDAQGRRHARRPRSIDELKEHVVQKIGAIARPDQILFAADLPKTRSGKIMRRLLRDIAEGKALGDTTTLADPNVVARLKDEYEAEEG